jgi:hypothetical protein
MREHKKEERRQRKMEVQRDHSRRTKVRVIWQAVRWADQRNLEYKREKMQEVMEPPGQGGRKSELKQETSKKRRTEK